ncbi:hypothetical protein [Thiorhodococcus fuscus]|uniref:Uncharacterized protein n=1 Tax=Thiorhodococcus fuscus TaxID=527200 RepID=A0ABW4YAZ0_9GAMM
MMRDYKIKQTEWPIHKKRKGARKMLLRTLLALIVIAAGYTAYEWIPAASTEQLAEAPTDPNIIPLQLPPTPATAEEIPASKDASNP